MNWTQQIDKVKAQTASRSAKSAKQASSSPGRDDEKNGHKTNDPPNLSIATQIDRKLKELDEQEKRELAAKEADCKEKESVAPEEKANPEEKQKEVESKPNPEATSPPPGIEITQPVTDSKPSASTSQVGVDVSSSATESKPQDLNSSTIAASTLLDPKTPSDSVSPKSGSESRAESSSALSSERTLRKDKVLCFMVIGEEFSSHPVSLCVALHSSALQKILHRFHVEPGAVIGRNSADIGRDRRQRAV